MPPKREFRLQLACTRIHLANGESMRALILSVAEMDPPQRDWILAGLALENGKNVVKPIQRADFIAAQGTTVTLTETRGMAGAPLLYTPTGGKAA